MRSRRRATGGSIPAIAARSFLGVCRGAVHQDVDVPLHQTDGRERDEDGNEESSCGVRARVACANENEADQHRDRPGQVAGEVERIRGQRRAVVAA